MCCIIVSKLSITSLAIEINNVLDIYDHSKCPMCFSEYFLSHDWHSYSFSTSDNYTSANPGCCVGWSWVGL